MACLRIRTQNSIYRLDSELGYLSKEGGETVLIDGWKFVAEVDANGDDGMVLKASMVNPADPKVPVWVTSRILEVTEARGYWDEILAQRNLADARGVLGVFARW